MKNLLKLSLCLLIIFLIYKFYLQKKQNPSTDFVVKDYTSSGKSIASIEEIPEKKITKIYFVGDMMMDRSVRKSVVKNFNGDYNQLFINLPLLKNADILFGNLEGDVSDVGRNVGSKYSFRMDPMVLPALYNAGFDIVSFANNHVGDWSIVAFTDTIKRLEENKILQTGAGLNKIEAEKPKVIEKNDTKFCFLGFTDVGPNWLQAGNEKPGILIASDPRFSEIIKNAKINCDVLTVSIHWGIEYKKIHNQRQQTLAHTAIDNGADLIIGHHPHVMQDIEIYKDKPIVYSLGNFIFDQYFSKDTMEGMLFEANYEGKNLVSINDRIIKLNSKYQPMGIFDKEDADCPKPEKKYLDYTYNDVGQDIAIPDKTYIPNNLVLIKKENSTNLFCLQKEARDQLELMINDAKKENYNIKVSSGFRNYDTQKMLLANKIKKGDKNAHKIIAKPGHSEHQLGVAVDLTSGSISYKNASQVFANTLEYKWLQENAYKYGYLESYPEDKEEVTGYMYESWHYRYVGIDHAANIIKNDQTINQYLEVLNK